MCASALRDVLSVPVGSASALRDAVRAQRALQSPRSWAEKPPTNLFLFNIFPLNISDASFGWKTHIEWE